MALRWFAVPLLVVAQLCASAQADACAGPCGAPELWDIHTDDEGATIVTNFGLLRASGSGFTLVCEETIGGLLLDAGFGEERNWVSTSQGVFRSDGEQCSYTKRPEFEGSDFLRSFAFRAGDVPKLYGLLTNDETGELHVVTSDGDAAFSTLITFESGSGYQELLASGDPTTLFVTGYTFMPRTFRLAYSLDDGESFRTATPPVDNETASVSLVGITKDDKALLHADTAVGVPDELYTFDGTSGDLEQVLELEGEADLGGLAIDQGRVYATSRSDGTGRLYVADATELRFETVAADTPPFSCLHAQAGVLYGCLEDFTAESPFIVGWSDDEGETWQSLMHLGHLGRVDSCGSECDATTEWLHGTYGVVGVPDAGSGLPPETPVTADAGTPPPRLIDRTGTGCSCGFERPAPGSWTLVWLSLMGTTLFTRRRRRSVPQARLTEPREPARRWGATDSLPADPRHATRGSSGFPRLRLRAATRA